MKPELHQSFLETFARCGMQGYYILQGERNPPGVAAVVGSGTHASTRANLAHKRDHGEMLPEDAVATIAAETFEARWARESPLVDPGEDRKTAKGQGKDLAVSLALTHRRLLAPKIHPTMLERKIVLELAGAPFDIGGTIDIVEDIQLDPDFVLKGEEPRLLRIRDTKTTAKRYARGTAAGHVQLHVYSWMFEAAFGRRPDELALDQLIKTKRLGPTADTDSAPPPKDYGHVFRRMETVAKAIESGIFMPVDPSGPSGWVCTAKFCGFFQRCPYGARARATIPVLALTTGEEEE